MNKEKGRFSFAARTIAALILLGIVLMAIATVTYADHYADQVLDKSRKQVEDIAAEVRGCIDVNPESTEYRNGFNWAQAAAVMRYYRFMKRPEFKRMGVDFDVQLYVGKEKNGVIQSLEELRPQTPVLLSAPFSRLGTTIVFADVFDDGQMKELESVLKKNESIWVETAKGYREGWFFFPTKLELENERSEKAEMQTAYQGNGKTLRTTSIQDIQILGSEGILAGDRDRGDEKPPKVLREYIAELQERVKQGASSEEIPGGNSSNYQWTSLEVKGLEDALPGNAVLLYGAEARPLSYALSQMKTFYLFGAAICVIIGGILLGGHNKVLERQWETEKKRRRMMDSMAHDLKTPLGIIKNYGEVLLEEPSPEKREQYTVTILEEADSMNEAVVSMLDLSKMEAGTYPMELSSLSVSELAEHLADRMETPAERKGVRLARKIQPTDRILADKKLLVNILSNFLSNALRHTKSGGYIELEVGQGQKGIRISVKNEGESISAEEMAKIWNSFYRSDEARKSDEGGSGLGLAIVRNACLMHGGSYGCENEEDGVRFWAEIPSLEKGLRKTEARTGPVLNVTGDGLRLKGLVMAAAGLIVQGLFGWIFYEAAVTELFVPDAGYIHIWPMSAGFGGFLWIGGGFSCLGLMRLKDRVAVFKTPFKAAAISWIVILALEVKLIQCLLADVDDGGWPLIVLELTVWLVSIVTVLLVFRACMLLAKQYGDKRFYRKMLWKCGFYLLLVISYFLFLFAGSLWGIMLLYSWIFWPGICVFAAWAWIQVYRRFNGKEPREE